jgi:small subunit ribosomal protein S4
MARYLGPKCKLCRREKVKLFLKGEKCYTKCILDKRKFPPGQHGARPTRLSEFAKRLREKQKAKRIYGILEAQFRRYVELATKGSGSPGENLMNILERRLDNVVFRSGFALSRNAARQLVRHKHVKVNGKVCNIPSFLVKPNDIISIRDKSREINSIKVAMEKSIERGIPSWIELDPNNFASRFIRVPSLEEINVPIVPQLIIEFYSR